MSERMKKLHYNRISANTYFWRTKQQQEIDYVEERGGEIYAYEFNLNPKKTPKFSKTFVNAYQPKLQLVNKSNFEDFLIF